MGSGKYLKHAIEKHGIENFTKDILFVFDTPEEMYAKEADIVNDDFLALENTYNLKTGGFGGFDYIPYWHIYTKHNPNNHNKQEKNVWEPDHYIIDRDNLDLRYEGNAFCVPKNFTLPVGLRKIELGESITSQLIFEGLL